MHDRKSLYIKILVTVAGLVFIFEGLRQLNVNTSNWPSVSGQIVGVRRIDPTRRGERFTYQVIYEYRVGNVRYDGFFVDSFSYASGETIPVYYNPASPKTSTTKRGAPEPRGTLYLMVGFGCVGLVLLLALKSAVGPSRLRHHPYRH